jgi:hypothetical protein
MPFIWCGIVSIDKSIGDWTFNSACFVDICNLFVPLLPYGRNQQPCLLLDLYNIYVDLDTPTILYQIVFRVFYILFCTYSKDIYNQLFVNDIHLILMPKVNICAFY